jgi:putative tricarboxylic transport membrane protein
VLADIISQFMSALDLFLSWNNILAIIVGMSAGITVGAIPGLGATMTIALLRPFTFSMKPVAAICMLLGIYKGSTYGGSISAILIHSPGTIAAAATAEDGYALTKQGKSKKALKMALYSSIIGDTFSDIVLFAVATPLALIAIKFGPAQMFGLLFFSLTLIIVLAGDSIIRGFAAAVCGFLVSTIGLDEITATQRFTFGYVPLLSGIGYIPVIVGLFGFSEVLFQVENRTAKSNSGIEKGGLKEGSPQDRKISWGEMKSVKMEILRGSVIGTIIGALPGLGGSISAFTSYADAKRRSKHPEKFGKGALEGIGAAESANNATCGANLIPLLTLGIPGDIVAAVLIGAFMIQGIEVGPLVFVKSGNLIYAIYIGMIVCNVTMLILGSIVLRLFSDLITESPKELLFPIVGVMCVIGWYSIHNSLVDVTIRLGMGARGYLFRKVSMPLAPFIISFILGPMVEENLRLALMLSQGSTMIFFNAKISLFFILLTTGFIVYFLINRHRLRRMTGVSK